MRLRAALGLVLALLGLAVIGVPAAGAAPPIRHVYVIVLENEYGSTTFGPNSPAPYLSKTLRAQGAYVPNYYGVGHESNDNYIAMISGQAPNPQTQGDCQSFDDFTPGTIGAYGQAQGSGCVFPASVPTIASQLTGAGYTWRDYNQSMGADPTRESTVCAHPADQRLRQHAEGHGGRQLRHPAQPVRLLPLDHRRHDAVRHARGQPRRADPGSGLTRRRRQLLVHHSRSVQRRPRRAMRQRPAGRPHVQADAFLKAWVPKITGTPAFRQDGLLMIIFDESRAPATRAPAAARSRVRTVPRPASPGRAAATRVRSSSRPASRRGRSPRRPTTITRCCAASRTSSAWPISATPRCPARPGSAPTSTTGPVEPRRRRPGPTLPA